LSTGVQTKVGTFIWHENNSTDVETAKRFYTELFGWETEEWPGEMQYTIIRSGGKGHGGFAAAQGGAPSHWNGNVFVEDADEAARRAEAAGGRILFGPESIPEVGRFALIADPQGAVVTAFSPQGEGGELGEGVFVWDELHTSDPAAAKSFYGEVFGWSARDEDMGGFAYTIFKSAGDRDVAGCAQLREGEPGPHWLTYVGTSDVDASAARAKELGGTVLVEPTDIPNDIGRFSVIQDPAGAVFGLFKPGSPQS
jgi:predicted enzyme related to lactoylglutathione lyase